MSTREYKTLQAEAGELQRMLNDTPEEFAIDRLSLKSRLDEVDAKLSEIPESCREPARSILTFNGKPVVGSHGIFADFGTKVMGKFTDAVCMMAASFTAPLAPTGPIPIRDQNRLLITNIALGSFGFELEEDLAQREVQNGEPSAVERAFESLQVLMEGTVGTDDELTEIMSDVDARVIGAVREYLDLVAGAEAICTFGFRDHFFRFQDVAQVRRSANRLRDDNVHSEDVSLNGQFEGAMPHRRAFEFKLSESGNVIYGKVDPLVENVDHINDIRHQPYVIRVRSKWVGSGRPRYTLLELPD